MLYTTAGMQTTLWKRSKFCGTVHRVATVKQKRNLQVSYRISWLHLLWKLLLACATHWQPHKFPQCHGKDSGCRFHHLPTRGPGWQTQRAGKRSFWHVSTTAQICQLSFQCQIELHATQRLVNQLVVDNQPHPVVAFKPKLLSKDSTPEEFAIWKDNFEVYFTASNAHNCDTRIQSVFFNTCIDEFLVSTLKKGITDSMPYLVIFNCYSNTF